MKNIPYGYHWIDKEDIEAVVRALKDKRITQGPLIRSFENALCLQSDVKYAVAVSSGTAALHIACGAAGLAKGDEVITSPLTFVASANCAFYYEGKPVFSDIDPATGNIDASKIAKNITKKTKIIIPVHYSGHPCDMKDIYLLAKNNNLTVIEDAAHALGARYKANGKWTKIGSCRYSDMTILSFHPVKHITTGEGGAVLTNNLNLYKKLLMLRTHGITKYNYINEPHGDWYYEMQMLGFNYRITDFQAALGISQLHKLNKFVKKRREIMSLYNCAFKNNEFFDCPSEKDYAHSSYHLYPIRLKEKYVLKKEKIFSALRKNGVGVQVHYMPVYLQPYYQKNGYSDKLCPNAEAYYKSELSIPIYPAMKKTDVNFVIGSLFKVLNKYR